MKQDVDMEKMLLTIEITGQRIYDDWRISKRKVGVDVPPAISQLGDLHFETAKCLADMYQTLCEQHAFSKELIGLLTQTHERLTELEAIAVAPSHPDLARQLGEKLKSFQNKKA